MSDLLDSQCKTSHPTCVSSLSVTQFRNLENQSIELAKGTNLFVGANGQGKSNLLEAIYLVATTRSFRRAKDSAMIRLGAEFTKVSVTDAFSEAEYELLIPRIGKRKAFLSGTSLPKVQALVGRLPSVCFSTSDMLLVTGEPSDRRRFLDLEISQISAKYLESFSQYKRGLEHRNALLKEIRDGNQSRSVLGVWDLPIAKHGSLLRNARMEYLNHLSPIAATRHEELAGKKEKLFLQYEASDHCQSEDELLALLEERYPQDISAGFTTIGPQRDDFTIGVDEISASQFASQGQQRTAVLAIKLAQADYWRSFTEQIPLLMLDDIFSDLDVERRSHVMAMTSGYGQVIITCTDLNSIDKDVVGHSKLFTVVNGLAR